MRLVKVAAVQMRCSVNVDENIKKADEMVHSAAASGANIILLPELFERQYFCQERRYEYYDFAKSVEENDAVNHFQAVAKELSVVIPVSFYEKDGTVLYNSVAVIDADGDFPALFLCLCVTAGTARSRCSDPRSRGGRPAPRRPSDSARCDPSGSPWRCR